MTRCADDGHVGWLRGMRRCQRTLLDRVDAIDIYISVAGLSVTFAHAYSMSTEEWSRDIDVNLSGALRVIQACLHTHQPILDHQFRALRSREPQQNPRGANLRLAGAQQRSDRVSPGLIPIKKFSQRLHAAVGTRFLPTTPDTSEAADGSSPGTH
jgi:NAD(P)-dependent dehydrogenase (short-subunit alcohol dehydrogenase family)